MPLRACRAHEMRGARTPSGDPCRLRPECHEGPLPGAVEGLWRVLLRACGGCSCGRVAGAVEGSPWWLSRGYGGRRRATVVAAYRSSFSTRGWGRLGGPFGVRVRPHNVVGETSREVASMGLESAVSGSSASARYDPRQALGWQLRRCSVTVVYPGRRGPGPRDERPTDERRRARSRIAVRAACRASAESRVASHRRQPTRSSPTRRLC